MQIVHPQRDFLCAYCDEKRIVLLQVLRMKSNRRRIGILCNVPPSPARRGDVGSHDRLRYRLKASQIFALNLPTSLCFRPHFPPQKMRLPCPR